MTTEPIVTRTTCNSCGAEASFTWPAGLAKGTHKETTMCPCGQGHDWTLHLR